MPWKRNRRKSRRIGLTVACLVLAGCKPDSATPVTEAASEPVQGKAISTNGLPRGAGTNAPFIPADFSKPDPVGKDGAIQLGWEKLSGFKYDLYDYYPEGHSGRPLLRSDDSIPAPVKAYDGKRVTVTGFVLPLRTRKGQVTEFLLLRDQGTCCFGARAQINHFIRVKFAAGIVPNQPVPWEVSGTLRVGEIYVQGYLTGIYEFEAEHAREL